MGPGRSIQRTLCIVVHDPGPKILSHHGHQNSALHCSYSPMQTILQQGTVWSWLWTGQKNVTFSSFQLQAATSNKSWISADIRHMMASVQRMSRCHERKGTQSEDNKLDVSWADSFCSLDRGLTQIMPRAYPVFSRSTEFCWTLNQINCKTKWHSHLRMLKAQSLERQEVGVKSAVNRGMKTKVIIMGIQARVLTGSTSGFVCELFSYHLL